MKAKVILLVDADGDCKDVVSRAGDQIGHRVRHAKTDEQALGILDKEMPRLAVVIVDVDPGVHGLALLEAIASLRERPPVIVITALEESYMKTVSRKHGATRCLGKPLTVAKLQSELRDVVERGALTSDRWGNLVPWKGEDKIGLSFRGIAAKLSPVISKRHRGRRGGNRETNDSRRRNT